MEPCWDLAIEFRPYLCQSFRGGSITGILLKASVDEVAEHVGPVRGVERGTVVLRDVVQRAHRVHVEVRRLAFS